MTLTITGDEPKFEEQAKVIELYAQNVNPTEIARQVKIRRVDVLHHIDEWKKTAVGSDVMKAQVEEFIASMSEHFGVLIRKAHEVIDEVDDDNGYEAKGRSGMLGQKIAAIKTLSELEAKRIDILQKSGLLEAADLGDELAEMEEQKDILLDILKTELCTVCKPKVMKRLAGEMGKDTVVVVEE